MINIGIDVGGSTTKIVGFEGDDLLEPLYVKASDPKASLFGAFGRFLHDNSVSLSDVEKITVTGVGSAFIREPIYGIKTEYVSEFESIAAGGLYLSRLEKAIIVSMGTGTAIVYADKEGFEYLGGTGVGGGTLVGLCQKMVGMRDIGHIIEAAADGDLGNVDLRIMDMTQKDISPNLKSDTTAANFGKLSDTATNGDIALGVMNMIYETAACLAIFAAREKACETIVLTGRLSTFPQAKAVFSKLEKSFNVNFKIPDMAAYTTAIGAALTSMGKSKV